MLAGTVQKTYKALLVGNTMIGIQNQTKIEDQKIMPDPDVLETLRTQRIQR